MENAAGDWQEKKSPAKDDHIHEDKYESLILTPEGTIIGMLGDKELKPETDPGWEARQAEKRAKRKRNQAFDDKPEASSESSERKDPKESSPLSFAGSAPELLVSEDEEPF